jgi:peptidoglycan-associated lipoprotein
MSPRIRFRVVLLVLIPIFLVGLSCTKKKVKPGPYATGGASEISQEDAERARANEAERQRALEEESLKDPAVGGDADTGTGGPMADPGSEAARIDRELFELEDIYFDFDSSALTPEAMTVLERKAEWLINNPGVKVTIEGHCDEKGTNEYNIALGDRRAEAAKAFLVDLGVAAGSIATISYGEERPVDPGDSEEARAKNRRCHFILN